MDRSTPVNLIKTTYTVDGIGQRVPAEQVHSVFADVQSVSRTEWSTAGAIGIKAAFVVKMFLPDYDGEKIAEVNGKRYGIYRTYVSRGEVLELYLEEKAGV